jgi:hypothetical protein
MIEIQADIPLGDAVRPAALAHSKVHQGGVRLILLPALALAGGIIGATLIGMILPLISLRLRGLLSLLWVAGGFLGLLAALRILARLQLRGFLDGLRRLGTPAVFHTRFRFDDKGIAIASQRSSFEAHWSSVLFVIPAPEHWLLQIDLTTLALPRRIFADAAAERSFLDLAAEHLTPDAKARSVFDLQ